MHSYSSIHVLFEEERRRRKWRKNTSAGFPALLTSADQRVVRNARRELLSLDEDAKKEVQPKIKDEKEEEEEEEELLMMRRKSGGGGGGWE